MKDPTDTVTAADVRLVLTCESHPEQYDAFIGDERVAYLRLRGGLFRVQCPHIDDDQLGFLLNETVYAAAVGDNEFHSETQRRLELGAAKEAIAGWYARKDEPVTEPAGAALPEPTPEQVREFLNTVARAFVPPADVLLRDRPLLGAGPFEVPPPREGTVSVLASLQHVEDLGVVES